MHRSCAGRINLTLSIIQLSSVVGMADEPNEIERLVAQRIRELLSEEGGLQRFIEGGRQLEAQMEAKRGEAALEVSVGLEAEMPIGIQGRDARVECLHRNDPACAVGRFNPHIGSCPTL